MPADDTPTGRPVSQPLRVGNGDSSFLRMGAGVRVRCEGGCVLKTWVQFPSGGGGGQEQPEGSPYVPAGGTSQPWVSEDHE